MGVMNMPGSPQRDHCLDQAVGAFHSMTSSTTTRLDRPQTTHRKVLPPCLPVTGETASASRIRCAPAIAAGANTAGYLLSTPARAVRRRRVLSTDVA